MLNVNDCGLFAPHHTCSGYVSVGVYVCVCVFMPVLACVRACVSCVVNVVRLEMDKSYSCFNYSQNYTRIELRWTRKMHQTSCTLFPDLNVLKFQSHDQRQCQTPRDLRLPY